MNIRMKVPQAAGIRRSVEVQHGTRGFGLMLRRGLHGSKNWVLELDENGEHRSVWSKAFRVFVVLIPVWVVLSAATGGPERGGHSTSAFQAVVMSLVITGVGLAVFSARERRLGREEPWASLRGDDEQDTEGDSGDAETLVEPSEERPTEVLENSQVSEVDSEPDDEFHADEDGKNEQNTQIVDPPVPQAIETEAETLAVPARNEPSGLSGEVPEQATSERAVDHGVPQGWNTPANTPSGAPTVVLEKAATDEVFDQVEAEIEAEEDAVPQAISDTPETPVTLGERNDLPDTPTVPFRPAFRPSFRETEEPQVEADVDPIRETVQGTLQVQFATPGPYPAKLDPVHENWWVVAPDVEPEEESGETEPEVSPEIPEGPQDVSYDPWADVDTAIPPEAASEPVRAAQQYPEEVQQYFASRVSMGMGEAEKEAAREAVMAWALTEVSEGRRSQSDVARLLGVGKATVSRWVNNGVGDTLD